MTKEERAKSLLQELISENRECMKLAMDKLKEDFAALEKGVAELKEAISENEDSIAEFSTKPNDMADRLLSVNNIQGMINTLVRSRNALQAQYEQVSE